jgi:hypothetical protein
MSGGHIYILGSHTCTLYYRSKILFSGFGG